MCEFIVGIIVHDIVEVIEVGKEGLKDVGFGGLEVGVGCGLVKVSRDDDKDKQCRMEWRSWSWDIECVCMHELSTRVGVQISRQETKNVSPHIQTHKQTKTNENKPSKL